MDSPSLSALDPWPQTVQWRPVSSRLIASELTQRAIWLVILLGVALTTWLIWESWWSLAAGAAVLVLNIIGAVVDVRAVRAYGYAERERDLLVRHGRMIRRLSIVPYARMQFVDVTAGPLERAFGIATVRLHTAAAASDATIPGLEPAEATRLRDRLAALGDDIGEGL
ncbi:PH domain-containing protein [Catelliglobosispora koreensis]|uniref:PH domain-containing protein n=1 Tax=Catelliglobosispora koreensis TaxID=129052 RepID=UPI0003665440|nr:PH domain-containing protein [Catelliglobosispora koreensis]